MVSTLKWWSSMVMMLVKMAQLWYGLKHQLFFAYGTLRRMSLQITRKQFQVKKDGQNTYKLGGILLSHWQSKNTNNDGRSSTLHILTQRLKHVLTISLESGFVMGRGNVLLLLGQVSIYILVILSHQGMSTKSGTLVSDRPWFPTVLATYRYNTTPLIYTTKYTKKDIWNSSIAFFVYTQISL